MAILAILAVLPSCGERAAPDISVQDSAGVRVVTIPAGTYQRVPQAKIDPTRHLDIGAIDGPSEYIFQTIDQILAWPTGGWLVVDRRELNVRLFDDEGGFVRQFGRVGKGPGEYDYLAGLSIVGASLLAWDPLLRRLSEFDTAGRFISSVQLEAAQQQATLYRLAGADGSHVILVRWGQQSDRRAGPVEWRSAPSLRYSRDGKAVHEVAEPLGVETWFGQHVTGAVLFGKASSHATDGRVLHITDGGQYEVRSYGKNGDITRLMRVIIAPTKPSRTDIDQMRGAFASLSRYSDEERPVAEFFPAISNLVADDAGRLWIEEYKRPNDRSRSWLVLSEAGTPLKKVLVPWNYEIKAINGHRIAGMWRDSVTSVESVRIYAEPKPAREAKASH